MVRTRKQKGTPLKNNPPPTLSEAQVTNDLDSSESENFITSDDDIASIHTNSESNQETSINDTDTSNSIQNTDVKSKPQPSNQANSSPKIPPIIIDINTWPTASKLIIPMFPGKDLTAKLVKNVIHLQIIDTETFRKAQSILSDNKIPFHTFSLAEERTLKVLLRGIPPSFSEDLVKTELELKGFEIRTIRQFLKDGRKLPMFMVTLPNNPSSKLIFDLPALFYITIRVEPYRSSGPAQCFACQGFGHSSNHCNHTPKCVKCGNNHETKTCSKTADQPPKCCNCGGPHTANYRKCPAYISALAEKQSNPTNLKSNLIAPTPSDTESKTPPKNTQLISSYASITSNKTNKQPEPTVTIPKQFFTNLLTEVIGKISESQDIKQTLMTAISAIISIINHHE